MDSIPNYHPYGDYNIELHDLTNQMDKAAAERLIEILRASPIPLSQGVWGHGFGYKKLAFQTI